MGTDCTSLYYSKETRKNTTKYAGLGAIIEDQYSICIVQGRKTFSPAKWSGSMER